MSVDKSTSKKPLLMDEGNIASLEHNESDQYQTGRTGDARPQALATVNRKSFRLLSLYT